MIEVLNRGFVSAWILAKDLPSLAEQSEDPDLKRLCALLQQHYTYPVDSILVSPALEVIGQMDVTVAMSLSAPSYAAFIEKSLAAVHIPPAR